MLTTLETVCDTETLLFNCMVKETLIIYETIIDLHRDLIKDVSFFKWLALTATKLMYKSCSLGISEVLLIIFYVNFLMIIKITGLGFVFS